MAPNPEYVDLVVSLMDSDQDGSLGMADLIKFQSAMSGSEATEADVEKSRECSAFLGKSVDEMRLLLSKKSKDKDLIGILEKLDPEGHAKRAEEVAEAKAAKDAAEEAAAEESAKVVAAEHEKLHAASKTLLDKFRSEQEPPPDLDEAAVVEALTMIRQTMGRQPLSLSGLRCASVDDSHYHFEFESDTDERWGAVKVGGYWVVGKPCQAHAQGASRCGPPGPWTCACEYQNPEQLSPCLKCNKPKPL